ncbi:hypothetical protein [Nocardiopsis aegyptia]|uniref:hypothetical protein n=1 Tax=Nocardiopsis aegyptia TaxID=220378 RepID=UPI0015C6E3A6|nr:hypothetical protein [Nocardiopsis aegyptia]
MQTLIPAREDSYRWRTFGILISFLVYVQVGGVSVVPGSDVRVIRVAIWVVSAKGMNRSDHAE